MGVGDPSTTPIALGMTPWALCMAPDGRHVYVSSPQGGRVLVVDTHTHRVTDSLACQSPGEMTVTPDGGRIHVAIASGVSVIDTGTEAVTAPSPSANVPGIALDPVRERLNASTSVGGFISVIDTDSDTGGSAESRRTVIRSPWPFPPTAAACTHPTAGCPPSW
jgi:YVTN family beta-propeller protein